MKQYLLRGLAFVIGGSIGLSAAMYSEAARKIEPKDGPKPFPIIIERQPEEEPEKIVKLTAGERTMLQKIAICEAGGEDPDSMALVMRTVLNRVENKDGLFPDDVEGVLFQRVEGNWQFSALAPGGAYWSAQPNAISAEALGMIENGLDESHGSLFFNVENLNSWARRHRPYLFSYGGHDYFG